MIHSRVRRQRYCLPVGLERASASDCDLALAAMPPPAEHCNRATDSALMRLSHRLASLAAAPPLESMQMHDGVLGVQMLRSP
jgi:hypothetical protein